jgi:hypothetical protein
MLAAHAGAWLASEVANLRVADRLSHVLTYRLLIVLASERLRRDDPYWQERLNSVYEPLAELAESGRIGVLGYGATSAVQTGLAYQAEPGPVPALLAEWRLPAVGMAAFEYGRLIPATPADADRMGPAVFRAMSNWLDETGLQRGFRSPRMQFAGQVVVYALPRPLALAASGDSVHCSGPSGPGTFGAAVQLSGVDSYLTAGHVAPVGVGTPVYDQRSNFVGKISQRMCCNFDSSGRAVVPNSDAPDVAVIALSVPDPSTSVTSQGVARIRDVVTAHGAVTSGQRAELSTVATTFAGPGAANWGEAMLTAYAISSPGDSGARVVNGAGEVVGQVVGGYPGVYSVVQDIDYLLKATGAVLR